ncbi:MAG: serine/threonine protein phosphatase [Myxococcales bacterium]|nr:serine/threonine protein phosphatase [Myxococcales bacterium]
MLQFSQDPKRAEQEMRAVIFYLTAFGYIDGDFDAQERAFVSQYIRRLITNRAEVAMPGAPEALKRETIERFYQHFSEVFEAIDQEVQDLFAESVAEEEEQEDFVQSRLKLRCFEIFQDFDRQSQEALMDVVDDLLMADGVSHPAEVKFRAELAALLEADLGVELIDENHTEVPPTVLTAAQRTPQSENSPFFSTMEFHYHAEHDKLSEQLATDRQLIQEVSDIFARQAAQGAGKLTGKQNVQALQGEAPFLDGHVYVLPTAPGHRYDITVLGDLHGCYSCLKAAVLQAQFFEKLAAWKQAPHQNPEPRLILLGDYIDRGLFSLNGVLRAVMQLVKHAPEHVYMLRGNHEHYFEYKGQVYGGVKPAEAINSLKPHVAPEVFHDYIHFFEQMPSIALVKDMLFVHGGIPRDLIVKERWRDLSSLNDYDIRFQMMWSDPSYADVIPAQLQEQSFRFAFGRLQAAAFLQRIGCHTVIRGHEKVNAGFEQVYNDPTLQLMTLFSCGGIDNDDLPPKSGFRKVTPMALSIAIDGDTTTITPWPIHYKRYNDPQYNAFFKEPPAIAHVPG